jgi:hypothetical protein
VLETVAIESLASRFGMNTTAMCADYAANYGFGESLPFDPMVIHFGTLHMFREVELESPAFESGSPLAEIEESDFEFCFLAPLGVTSADSLTRNHTCLQVLPKEDIRWTSPQRVFLFYFFVQLDRLNIPGSVINVNMADFDEG